MQLVPNSWGSALWESNDCHTPAGSPAGGQFCTTGLGARHIPAGRPFDIVSAVRPPGSDSMARRFLYNPKTREVILGSTSHGDQEYSHADAFNAALPADPLPKDAATVLGLRARGHRFDQFSVHGHLWPQNGKPGTLEIHVGSLMTPEGQRYRDPTEAEDVLADMASRFVGMGAPRTATIAIPGIEPVALGKAFPELFKTRRKRAA